MDYNEYRLQFIFGGPQALSSARTELEVYKGTSRYFLHFERSPIVAYYSSLCMFLIGVSCRLEVGLLYIGLRSRMASGDVTHNRILRGKDGMG